MPGTSAPQNCIIKVYNFKYYEEINFDTFCSHSTAAVELHDNGTGYNGYYSRSEERRVGKEC